MSDRVLIPFGPELLVLTEEEFAVARDRGRAMATPSEAAPAEPGSPELVTAGELAADLSLAKSCIYEHAKAGRIPSVRVGRHVRFNRQAVLAALAAGHSPVDHA